MINLKRPIIFLIILTIMLSQLPVFAFADSSTEPGFIDFFFGAERGEEYLLALHSDGYLVLDDKEAFAESLSAEPSQVEELLACRDIVKLSFGVKHLLALRRDGSVLAVGDNSRGQCDVDSWSDIEDIAVGWYQSFGVTKSGRVMTAGEFSAPKLNAAQIATWRNVEQLKVGLGGMDDCSVIALCSDGRVLGMGEAWGDYGWEGHIENAKFISTDGWISGCILNDGSAKIWGLKSDHRYKYFGPRPNTDDLEDYIPLYEQVANWDELEQIFFDELYAVGLKSDGTVYHSVHQNEESEAALETLDSWKDIEKLFFSAPFLIGLKKDSTLSIYQPHEQDLPYYLSEEDFEQMCSMLSTWTDIADIKICENAVIGYKTDGSVIYCAPKYEKFLALEQDSSASLQNSISSPKDKFVDFAFYNYNDAALLAWRSDGSVCSFGLEPDMEKDVAKWTDIVRAGFWIEQGGCAAVYGIKKDGSVVFSGPWPFDDEPWSFAKSWKNVAQIAVYDDALVLLNDGRVHDKNGEFLEGWEDIVSVNATACPQGKTFLGLSDEHKLLSADDTMGFEFGYDLEGEYSALKGHTDNIIAYDSNAFFVAAIKEDGTVVTNHRNLSEKVSDWKNIVQLCVAGAGRDRILGLTEDGRIKIATNEEHNPSSLAPLEDWKDISCLYYGDFDYSSSQANIVIGIGKDGRLNILAPGDELKPMMEWKNVVKLAGHESSGTFVALTEDGELLIHGMEPLK